MKTIEIKESTITNGEEHTYYIKFPAQPNWNYTIRCTEEGLGRMMDIWREAGYEIKHIELASKQNI